MADAIQLKTEPRTGQGSRDAVRLRKAGRVPAVVYGHKEATVAVTVSPRRIGRPPAAPRPDRGPAGRRQGRDGADPGGPARPPRHGAAARGLPPRVQGRAGPDDGANRAARDGPRGDRRRRARPAAAQDSRRVPGHRRSRSRSGSRSTSCCSARRSTSRSWNCPTGVKALDDPDLVVVQVKQQVAVAASRRPGAEAADGRAGGHHARRRRSRPRRRSNPSLVPLTACHEAGRGPGQPRAEVRGHPAQHRVRRGRLPGRRPGRRPFRGTGSRRQVAEAERGRRAGAAGRSPRRS